MMPELLLTLVCATRKELLRAFALLDRPEPISRCATCQEERGFRLVVAHVVKAIDGEVEALADSHAGGAHEQERDTFDRSPLAKLCTDAKVILG